MQSIEYFRSRSGRVFEDKSEGAQKGSEYYVAEFSHFLLD